MKNTGISFRICNIFHQDKQLSLFMLDAFSLKITHNL